MLAPRNPTVEKLRLRTSVESHPGGTFPNVFPVRFYLIAMLFVIFDIEIVFLYPWAVNYQALGLFGLVAILIFSALVFESFVYLIAKGALDWGPLQISRRQDPMRSRIRRRVDTVSEAHDEVLALEHAEHAFGRGLCRVEFLDELHRRAARRSTPSRVSIVMSCRAVAPRNPRHEDERRCFLDNRRNRQSAVKLFSI